MMQSVQQQVLLEQKTKFQQQSRLSQNKQDNNLLPQEKNDSPATNLISDSAYNLPKDNHHFSKNRQSNILLPSKVQKSLKQIYSYYNQSYVQQIKQCQGFDLSIQNKLKLQPFLLFAKNFNILRTIFPLQRITILFKKHATFGKYLTFDNFCSLVDILSHEPQTITYLRIESIVELLDQETREELEKQEFYNFLKLGSKKQYRKNYTDLFGAFNILEKPRNERAKQNSKKLSLPLINKKQITLQKKRDVSEVKRRHDYQQIAPQNIYGKQNKLLLKPQSQHQKLVNNDQVKQIMVSWQILKSKSANDLRKSQKKSVKPYIKNDPQEQDPYLRQLHPPSKQLNFNNLDKHQSHEQKISKNDRKNKIEHQIQQIQKRQNIKNQQIMKRIDKLQIRSNRKFVT